jgi:hypothetical protein
MFQFEIDVRAGKEAERFNTAVYRFLELHGDGLDGLEMIKIETHPAGTVEHKKLTLWSTESVSEFQTFWAKARRG